MKHTPDNPKRYTPRAKTQEATVHCHRCGVHVCDSRNMKRHLAGNQSIAFCPEVRAVVFNREVAGTSDERWRMLCEQEGDGEGHVYAYYRETDDCIWPTYFGWCGDWDNRVKAIYGIRHDEKRVVIADNCTKQVGTSMEGTLLSCFDLDLPINERPIRHKDYMHVYTEWLPEWLEREIQLGYTTRKVAFVFMKTEALKCLKNALGPKGLNLTADKWMTLAKEADANASLSRIVKRQLNYTSNEYPDFIGHATKKYVDEGSRRGSLAAEDQRSIIVTAGGRVLRARNDAERYLIDEFVERFEADRPHQASPTERKRRMKRRRIKSSPVLFA